jgi:hypothetical protein
MRRTHVYLALVLLCPLAGLGAWLTAPGRAQPRDPAPAESPRKTVPLTQVVLFNTGVGYFQRQGAVEGDTRVDLSFPLTDVNDLLKSLIVEDGGKLGPVSYDSAEPAERTLRAFALDLNGNPTFGQILNQARGEKVEVVVEATAGGATTTVTGTVVGMEALFESATQESHHLTVLSTEGMRRIPLTRIARVRFLNPTLADEFRRALGVLASGHGNQRRSLSLHLHGDGKRDVKIGYVVESSIWKSTYRLVLDGKTDKAKLLGWAVVENATDEDWKDVRTVLVSGRPITFEMNLSQPLFVPRPTLEQEVYASLRPPTHAGPVPAPSKANFGAGGGQLGVQIGGLGALGGGLGGGGSPGPGFSGGLMIGGLDNPANPTIQANSFLNRYQIERPSTVPPRRLSYEELVQRRDELLTKRQEARNSARRVGSLIAGSDESIESIALDADRIGESFSYPLERKVTLPRQKSALLPILDSAVQLTRLSVYNDAIHPRFPLLSLKFKNVTDQHLLHGPIAVFEGGGYVGDSRLPDLQPGQERLISYAMDLGLEVRPETHDSTDLVSVSIRQGKVWTAITSRRLTDYRLRNRSRSDRALVVEHPIIAGFALAQDEKPAEATTELYRFRWQVPAGKTVEQQVVETSASSTSIELAKITDGQLDQLIARPRVSKPVHDALAKFRDQRRSLARLRLELAELQRQRQTLLSDQDRARLNLEKLPAGSAPQKKALERFEQTETQLEKLTEQLRDKTASEKKLQEEHEGHVKDLTVR